MVIRGSPSFQPNHHNLPSCYLTVCHGKSPFLIGKPSISMGHLFHGKLLVITRGYIPGEPRIFFTCDSGDPHRDDARWLPTARWQLDPYPWKMTIPGGQCTEAWRYGKNIWVKNYWLMTVNHMLLICC
jgi:hypothetical protein